MNLTSSDSDLTPEEAAAHLDITEAHLKVLGDHGDGPAFTIRNDEIKYTWNAVLEYEAQRNHFREICEYR